MTKAQVLWRFAGLAAATLLIAATLGLVLVRVGARPIGVGIEVVAILGVLTASWSCFTPNAPLFGWVITGKGTRDRVMALTFDDGPSAEWTPGVLDALKTAGVTATFFILGRNARAHPEIVRRIRDDGHEIASHGHDHALLTFASAKQIRSDLARTEDALAEALGDSHRPTLFRAPHGFRNPYVRTVMRERSYAVAGWTKGVWDSANPGVEKIVDRCRKGFRPGAILLLHDADGSGAGGSREQTVQAVGRIVQQAEQAGFRFVSLSELAALAPPQKFRIWRFLVGIAALAAVLGIAVRQLDVTTLERIDIGWWWVLASLGLNLLSVAFKAVAWKLALDTIPNHPHFHYSQVLPALFIGFLVNSVIPARLGEVARVSILRRRARLSGNDVPVIKLAGTVVAEQIVSTIALVAVVLVLLASLDVSIPHKLKTAIVALGAVALVLILSVVGIYTLARNQRFRRRGVARSRFDQAVLLTMRIVQGLEEGQALFRRPPYATAAIGASVLSWAAQVAGIYAALDAFGIHPTLGRAGLVFLATTVLQLFPIIPGNVGSFQITCATALLQYQVSFTRGIAFGIGLQLIEITLGIGLGFWFLSREGLSLQDVRNLRDDD